MKYSIETTDKGCKEVLDFGNGTILERESERTEFGYKCSKSFDTLLLEQHYCREITDKVAETFGNFLDLNFLELVDLLKRMRLIE